MSIHALKPWTELVKLHADVESGSCAGAKRAAHRVPRGRGVAAWSDRRHFHDAHSSPYPISGCSSRNRRASASSCSSVACHGSSFQRSSIRASQ